MSPERRAPRGVRRVLILAAQAGVVGANARQTEDQRAVPAVGRHSDENALAVDTSKPK